MKKNLLLLIVCLLINTGLIGQRTLRQSDFQGREFKSNLELNNVTFKTKANFEGTRFYGFTDFSRSTFDSLTNFSNAEFSLPVSFSGDRFRGDTKFNNAKFFSGSSFRGAQFFADAEFFRSEFHASTDFSNIHFIGPANFYEIHFRDTVDFRFVEFNNTSFNQSQFDSLVWFSVCIFNGPSQFLDNKFLNGADYSFSLFKSLTYFIRTEFKSSVDFSNTEFEKSVLFDHTSFDSLLSFRNARLNGKLVFKESILPEFLVFNRVKTNDAIDLSETVLDSTMKANGEKCKLDLIRAPIDKIILSYDNFQIYKPDSIPSKEHYQSLIDVYKKLLKNFKDNNLSESYNALYREYALFKLTKNPDDTRIIRFFGYFRNWMNSMWFDYGLETNRIFINTTMVLLVFTFLNFMFFSKIQDYYEIEGISSAFKLDPRSRSILSFYYTCLVFFGLKMTMENLNFNKPLGIAYVFLQYVIGLVCLAFIAKYGIDAITTI